MKNIISYLRIREWLDSKVTFMLGILMLFFFSMKTGFEMEAVAKVAAYFLYVSMFLAISYVVNDYADLDIDKKAGKEKVIAHMPKWSIWCSIIAMAIAGNVPILLYADNKAVCVVLIILTYFLGLAYSIPGIRFKERGLWGLIECSFAQRCMPLLIIISLIKLDTHLVVMLAGWVILSFVDGLRYIIIHQVNDLENDVATGVNTYVSKKRGDYRKKMIGLLTAEIAITCILLIPLIVEKPILTLAILLFNFCLEYCIYVVIQKYAMKDIMLTYDSVPMEGFYNALFPVLTGLCMAFLDIRWIAFLIFIIIISFNAFMVKCNIARVFVQSKKNTRR